MNKFCNGCKKVLPLSNFSKAGFENNKHGKKQAYASRCKACKSLEYKTSISDPNVRKQLNERAGILNMLQKTNVMKYLATHPCIDCGETNRIVLEFDHVRGDKFMAISTMIVKRYPWEDILIEIGKCDVRCANCHTIKTAKERNSYRWKYKDVL